MKDGQSEQKNSIKKAMKLHEIMASDQSEFARCKDDLMEKLHLGADDALEVASSIREEFLPKLIESEGLSMEDFPEEFIGKMSVNDDDFADDIDKDNHEFDIHEDETTTDDSEVDANEIAKIHISVPADKLRDVEKALEDVLANTDSESKDLATDHEINKGDNKMSKELEARKALRKQILAAVADEEMHVSRKDGFEHSESEQYREEQKQNTFKGDLHDPDTSTLDFNKLQVPSMKALKADLGLIDEIEMEKGESIPSDAKDFELMFDELADFEVPSQGNTELYHDLEVPSEQSLSLKRTVQSSVLGEFDADAAEEVLAHALRSAGVDDTDLGKLTYAEGLQLFKAIKTAEAEREHYSKDGKMTFPQNKPKDPDHEKVAVTEEMLREDSPKEIDPEKDHERSGPRELYSSADDYATMLRKLMKGAQSKDGIVLPSGAPIPSGSKMAEDEDHEEKLDKHHEEKMEKEAELYRARVKTAYAMSSKLAAAGLLPSEDIDAYAEGMMNDNLNVTAMIRQTKILLNTAAANFEKRQASNSMTANRTASTGITFNPSVRGASADLSGANEIQNALRGLGWTAPQVETGMEE